MVTHQTPNVSQAGFDIKTFSRGASDSASFNFISLNPVSVQNDDWFINKAHPLMKVSSNIKLFSSHIETNYLSSKTKVPKDSESLLEVKFDDLNEFNSEKDVLFEPVKMKSLFLAHSVSKIEDGKMYVSAINVSGKDVEMDSGQKVGSINEVANVEVESVEAEVRKREAEVC